MWLHLLLVLIGLEHGYSIPTSSMQPSLNIGEIYVFRNYRLYGVLPPSGLFTAPPKMGDVVVHKVSATGEIWAKRVMGVAGDTVQMRGGRLYINGVMVKREYVGTFEDADSAGVIQKVRRYVQTLPNGVRHYIQEISDDMGLDDTPVFTVPAGHYFVMGDNHDRSADSRVPKMLGFVPYDSLLGRLDDVMPVEIPGR